MRINTGLGGMAGLLAAALVLAACGSDDDGGSAGGDASQNADATEVTLTITDNAIAGGKNSEGAAWITDYVIPEFTAMQEEQGVDVTIEFEENGVDDEDYKTKIALDLQSGAGGDIISIDGIWTGEFAEAGYIAPLTDVAGDAVEDWDGWEQIPEAVQQAMSFDDQAYGIPVGTDGRVIYFNKDLFAQAGLPEDWQPTSWDEILEAARALKQLDGVTPLQVNAGVPMGEATTMQGFLPLLAGTGEEIWADDAWTGASEGVTEVLDFYGQVYGDEALGDPLLQQEAQGRDTSFQLFASGQLGMLIESDYLWRSVINPDGGIAPMTNRDEVVGWARIPAREPGAGLNGQDFVSMSGGTGRVINPNTEFPQQAWELMMFMNSPEALQAMIEIGGARITPRDDVNADALAGDPLMAFIAEEVLPITAYRPALAVYPQVSVALQNATAAVSSGTSADDAAADYQSELEGIVGGDGSIAD
ncbi:extracellular solute-binding protein [Jiangella alkaliphila]|uniref:Carbohydrate ABC transporter substrate-binding protein, CUT1 family n=1 Tax=Jiangella alkaliphila TaxID=419479 RepID=A0A1H2K3F5_9ACTN|nr:extracellular solute-binding protein [Jiangella alkaliphila]SDU62896.1 carbohydrate ABC transporter substrate-binding protein, CUT1 family [Jiangella alkaliphila]